MKKILSLVCIVLLAACLCFNTNVFASPPNIIVPFWNNIGSMTNIISFNGTAGNATASITGKAGTTNITGTLTVYKITDDGQEYVNHNTGSSQGRTLGVEVRFTGESGADYIAIFEATVTINGVDESESKTASGTCP